MTDDSHATGSRAATNTGRICETCGELETTDSAGWESVEDLSYCPLHVVWPAHATPDRAADDLRQRVQDYEAVLWHLWRDGYVLLDEIRDLSPTGAKVAESLYKAATGG